MTDKVLEQDLRWQQFEASDEAQFTQRVMCIGSVKRARRMSNLARQIVWQGYCVDLINDLEESLEVVVSSPTRWTLLIVDVDYAERKLDLEDIVDALVDFREKCPKITIVLISYGFLSDDASQSRRAIADYCFNARLANESIIARLIEVYLSRPGR